MGQGMAKGTGGGAGGTAAELAVGFGIAQEMMKQGGMTASTPGATAQAAELMGLPEAAKFLGVSEADVMAAITEGTLKAKKIGSQYRITKAALDAFLAE
jgi:excisionase family DNA binding protein